MNTVSSVEREITALPAIVARYEGNVFQTSLKAGAGWFFLEIDDDVYQHPGEFAILPWDNDLLVRLWVKVAR